MSARILIGDVRDKLRELDADSVDCVVTSPPYWALRDYGVAGQIGMEATWQDHLAVMLDVFREVRRVMKPAATLWLNYGDGYATHPNGRKASEVKAGGHDDRTFRDKPMSTIGGTFKPKDLLMMPNRLAIALQDDGWWVRAECIWGKPNPMPDSSGRFRPSGAHEKIFLLVKSNDGGHWVARDTGEISGCPDLTQGQPSADGKRWLPRWLELGHYYDAAAVKKPVTESSAARYAQNVDAQRGSDRANAGAKTNGAMKAVGGPRSIDRGLRGHLSHTDVRNNGRLLRNYEPEIWTIATVGSEENHFATFPPALAQRCILAGCPRGGVVLDPFGGVGTTGLVAARMGQPVILIELNPESAAAAQRRLEAATMRPVDAAAPVVRAEMPLFGGGE